MPPKSKVTKEMVVDAAFEIVREAGADAVSARAVAKRLNCSTQPVLYHFATMEELKRAVYARADHFHTEYLMNGSGGAKPREDPLLEIGLNYIRFAVKEPRLFRFLFQSGYVQQTELWEMLDSEELAPVLSAMREGMGMDMEKTKEVFLTVAMFVHGYAGIIAGNALKFDEDLAAVRLERAFRGAVLAVCQEEEK